MATARSGELFGAAEAPPWTPLAERMRPRTMDEYVGQQHLLGEGRFLHTLFARKVARSLIFWGPPGTGKTTLARLYAEVIGAVFHPISAVLGGVKDVRQAVEGARIRGEVSRQATVLFIDEIHRFNKAQQDSLLPFVETGVVTLIGATTENPGFEVIHALRSRARVLQLRPLDSGALRVLAERALKDDERGLGATAIEISDEALDALIESADGDARGVLNTLEIAADIAAREGDIAHINVETITEARQKKTVLYDKKGDAHYQAVSAFIKSMRGGDPDAALYYMIRMLEAGEDPKFILRRMVIFASEDIGNADPNALQVAVSARDAFDFIGLPEGVLPMTQAATYLATAPKSNSVLMAYGRARKDALAHPNLEVPKHIVNAPTAGMKALGYGRGYKYPHNFDGNYVPEEYLPEALRGNRYYEASDSGFEAEIRERLKRWRG